MPQSAQTLCLRKKRVLKAVNPDIQDLTDKDEPFTKASPDLFGSGFRARMKEWAESIKILKVAKPLSNFFFTAAVPFSSREVADTPVQAQKVSSTGQRGKRSFQAESEKFITYSEVMCISRNLMNTLHYQSTIVKLLVEKGLTLLAMVVAQRAYPLAGIVSHFLRNWSVVSTR